MTTVREVVTRALRRARVTAAGETPSSEDASDVLAMLNGMLFRWASQGVDAKHAALGLNDAWSFFVPPATSSAELIAMLGQPVAWNASTNTPTLASGTGTKGDFYKVTVAGSTALDGIASWAVNDYAVFDGAVWLKSMDPARFERAVIDLLALEMCPDFGMETHPVLVRGAADGWRQIQAAYIKAQTAGWDAGITNTYARPWTAGVSGLG